MRTALIALFFLLFASCSEADDVVLDVENNPVRPGKPYHIRDATNCEHAISLDLIGNQTCPISVVMAIDPKQVIFHSIKHKEVENITARDPLEIEFSWTSECANPPNWRVQADACAVYPLVVGPPDKRHVPGSFRVKKAKDERDAYNLVFNLHEVDEHVVSIRSYNDKEDLSVLKLCSEEGLKVKFYPIGRY
ncbi:subtilisin inhibitor CLSI-II-like [Prosopis cineraria]|uniref:subtilisin inhibitor CLSI-II-like n=1 Tax=Prosopis cineraria TaxID=364024 RepID=UPI00240F3BED|nr:subtilisin inhibitor CLSI-II-like [Prosopis cineraria]